MLVDDVPDSFFTNYNVDVPVESDDDFDPNTEEEETPGPSYNLGLKQRINLHLSNIAEEDRRCARLQRAVNKIQKRLARLGVERDDIGNDYISECSLSSEEIGQGNKNKNQWRIGEKVEVCHIPQGDLSAASTLNISASALGAHLAHGDYIGACNDDETDDADDDDEVEEELSIEDVEADVNGNEVTITWSTDVEADSVVEYALSPLGAGVPFYTVSEDGLTEDHEIVIESLTASTTYYFQVKSTDDEDNEAESEGYSFVTGEELDTVAPTISNGSVLATGTEVVIEWDTNEPATGKVYYANESLNSAGDIIEDEDDDYSLDHSFTLEDLATSTTYYYYVESSDEAGNTASTDESSFEL